MGNTNLATKFLKAMNLISQHNIETSSATVTIEGTVQEAVENKAGEYIVALSDTANVTACANAVYATGDRVLLLQPSTENQKYTILYKINANSDVNIFRTQEDIWNRLGGNAIIGSVNKEFNGATGESIITNALQDGYADYIEKSHNLQLQVDFYANLLAATSSWENLNYGIKIKYKYRDLDSGEEGFKTEVFDINSMSGNPFWTANNYSREYITFNIDEKHEFLSIEQILFFWENLSELENIELKIKDLALYSVTPADVEKGYEALVYINGADRFAATSDSTATVELECRLKYQGLLQDTEDCVFVWAKENPAIDKNDGDFYDSRAGAGWEFLNESDAGDASYALPIARAAAPEQKIKCVVIKEGKILATSEPIVIKNLNTALTFDFEITSTEPDSNAKVILTIAEKDGTPFKEEVTYKWSRTLASGLYQDIEGKTNSIEVDLNSLAGYAVYKCIIQSDTVYYGAAEISLDMLAVTDEKRVQILGATTFLYNLGGERVTAPSDIENILEVVFFDNDGNIINYKDEGKEESNYEVEWIFPANGNSLIFVSDAKADALTKNKVEYSLASTYNITHAQNNTVKVIVTYEGKSYEAIIEMGFLRQGQPGTNGTQYICDIAVNGSFKDWIYVDDYNIGNLSTQLKDIASNQNVPFSGLKYEYKTAENKEWQSIFSNTVINKAAIIRATVEEGNQVFYGYLTLVEKNGDLEWLPDTGFIQVLYSSSHTNPQYAASKFKFNKEVIAASDNNFTIKNIRDTYAIEIEPIAQYDGAAPFILLWVNEKGGESNIKIPLLYTYNRWEYAAINNWDGESVSTEDGWVLAPSAGFGEKNENNQFSGVVLGTREKGADSEQGIYGYCEGEETFRLDAADGSARFGRPGKGAIEIVPGAEKAIIQGGAYEEGKSGMQIDLTTPEIKWGNGNFFVGEDGIAHLKGAVITAKELTDEDGNPLVKARNITWAALVKDKIPVAGVNEQYLQDSTGDIINWVSVYPTNTDASLVNVWERLEELYFDNSAVYTVRNLTGPSGEDGQDGSDAIVLSLSNNNDTVAKTAAGVIIGELPIVKAIVSTNGQEDKDAVVLLDEDTLPSGFEQNTHFNYENNELVILSIPNNFSYGTFNFKYKDLVSTFTLRLVISEVDYNLSVGPTVINNSLSDGAITIKVLKTDAAGVVTELTESGQEPNLGIFWGIKVVDANGQTHYAENPITRGEWKIEYKKGDMPAIRIVVKQLLDNHSEFIWDEQIIEFVQNGTDGIDGISPTLQKTLIYFTQSVFKPENNESWSVTELDKQIVDNLTELEEALKNEGSFDFDLWYQNTTGIKMPITINNIKVYPWIRQATLVGDKYLLTAPQLAASDATIVEWCKEGNTTLIDGGKIYAGSVSAGLIKTDSIRSFNYMANEGDFEGESSITVDNGIVTDIYEDGAKSLIPTGEHGFPVQGTYLDLTKGNFYAPGFRLGDVNNIAGWEITNSDIRKVVSNSIIKKSIFKSLDVYPAYIGAWLICNPLKINQDAKEYACELTDKWFETYLYHEYEYNYFLCTVYFLNNIGKIIQCSQYEMRLFAQNASDIRTFSINITPIEPNNENNVLTNDNNKLILSQPNNGWPEGAETILIVDTVNTGSPTTDDWWSCPIEPVEDFTFANDNILKIEGEIINIKTESLPGEEFGADGKPWSSPVNIIYSIDPSTFEADNLEEYQQWVVDLSIKEVSFETWDSLELIEEEIYFPFLVPVLNVENKITFDRGFVTKMGCLLDYEKLDESYMFYVADETNESPDIKFSVSAEGKLYAKNAYIEGIIQGSKIIGSVIESEPDKDGKIPFSINKDGFLIANSGVIAGLSLSPTGFRSQETWDSSEGHYYYPFSIIMETQQGQSNPIIRLQKYNQESLYTQTLSPYGMYTMREYITSNDGYRSDDHCKFDIRTFTNSLGDEGCIFEYYTDRGINAGGHQGQHSYISLFANGKLQVEKLKTATIFHNDGVSIQSNGIVLYINSSGLSLNRGKINGAEYGDNAFRIYFPPGSNTAQMYLNGQWIS